MNPLSSLQLHRYQDILLVQGKGEAMGSPIGFHSKNLSLAQLSEETTASMTSISLNTDHAPTRLTKPSFDIQAELQSWLDEEVATAKISKPQTSKIRSVTLNVTQICNLHCTYCAAGGDGSFGDPQTRISIQKTLPQLQFLLGKLNAGEEFHVSFLGGEPLLYPQGMQMICEFVEAEAKARDLKISFKVTTNGTIMTPQILDLLEKHRIAVVVSCDGPPEVQNKQRPSKSKFTSSEMVEKSLGLLLAKPAISVGVHAVMNEQNPHVARSYEYFKKFGFAWYEFTFAVDDNSPEAQNIYLEELFQVAQAAYVAGGMTELRKIQNFNTYISLLEKEEGIENHCGIGKNFLMIDARNDVYPCPWMVGMAKDKLGHGADFEMTKKFAESLIELHECQSCWARNLCGGGCHFIHKYDKNSDGKKNTQFCERTRATAMMAIYFYGNDLLQTELN